MTNATARALGVKLVLMASFSLPAGALAVGCSKKPVGDELTAGDEEANSGGSAGETPVHLGGWSGDLPTTGGAHAVAGASGAGGTGAAGAPSAGGGSSVGACVPVL